jgi:DNA-binding IclR family transcriptional regulator
MAAKSAGAGSPDAIQARRLAKDGAGAHSKSVGTLVKALDILNAMSAASAMSVAQIAAAVRLNRTTTHRIVQTLASYGYVQALPQKGFYAVGFKVLPLAGQLLDSNRVRVAALPHLNDLAMKAGERVNLGVLFDGELLYIAGIEKPSLPNVYSRFGKRAPVHCCSLGKAILAFLPAAAADEILAARGLVRETEGTIVDRAALAADFAATRSRGYALDREEHLPNTFCIAAPIFDAARLPIAAVGVSGGNLDNILAQADNVRLAAEIVTHVLAPAVAV